MSAKNEREQAHKKMSRRQVWISYIVVENPSFNTCLCVRVCDV